MAIVKRRIAIFCTEWRLNGLARQGILKENDY
jgi:hypothetical protein